MTYVTLALGAVGTIGGAAALVAAYRHSQSGRRAAERRWFAIAVAALAVGSLAFLLTVAQG